MPVFVICRVKDPVVIGEAVERAFPSNSLSIAPNEWLISVKGKTAREVSEALGLNGNTSIGQAIVLQVGGYWGRAPTDIWDWIKTRMEADG